MWSSHCEQHGRFIITSSFFKMGLLQVYVTVWRNIESLVWKSNLYFVSPGCFWRNWTVLHFQLELHDRNYWLRPSLTAWLLSSTPIKMSVGQNRTQSILYKHLLSHIFVCFLRILNLNSGPFLWSTECFYQPSVTCWTPFISELINSAESGLTS